MKATLVGFGRGVLQRATPLDELDEELLDELEDEVRPEVDDELELLEELEELLELDDELEELDDELLLEDPV